MDKKTIQNIWPEWKLIREIGSGSYGVVYEAERTDGRIHVRSAIKVIEIPSSRSEVDSLYSEGMSAEDTRTFYRGIVEDFIREIQVMESLKGTQNIVSIEDYKVIEHTECISWTIAIRMELLTPFNTYIRNNDITEQDAIRLGTDICSALELCEQQGVLHRDVKPENIFVNKFGSFKLGDFGIARKMESSSSAHSMKGTVSYMAPEVERGERYGQTVDLYSLGLVLYKMMNDNRLPFMTPEYTDSHQPVLSAQERSHAIRRRLSGEPLPPPCNASEEMAEVILIACDPLPEYRFQSAGAMRRALTNVRTEGTIRVRPPVFPEPAVFPTEGSRPPRTVPSGKKKKPRGDWKLLWVLVILAAAAAAAAVVYFTLGPKKEDDSSKTEETTEASSETEEVLSSAEEEVSKAVSQITESAQDVVYPEEEETEQVPSPGENPVQTEINAVLENASLLEESGDYEGALALVETELAVYPESADLLNRKAELMEKIHQAEEKVSDTPTPEAELVESTFYIIGNAKNIRKEPTYYSDLVIKISDSYQPLYYHGESEKGLGADDKEHLWYRIYTEDGTAGWIREEYVSVLPGQEETPTPTPKPEQILYITGNAKNLRAEPSYYSDLVIKISDSSQPLYFYGESAEGPGKDYKTHIWYHIYTEDGTSAWIREEYVSTLPDQE